MSHRNTGCISSGCIFRLQLFRLHLGGDPVISITKASKECADATGHVSQDAVLDSKEVSQTTLTAATEVSDVPRVNVATADKISPGDSNVVKDHLNPGNISTCNILSIGDGLQALHDRG
ncbi:hypothetical protein ACQJBY_029531 [Aegilops geniculata]